jgi:hypothetical protein
MPDHKQFRVHIDLEKTGLTMDDAVQAMAAALARDVEVQVTLRIREFYAVEGRYPRFAWCDHLPTWKPSRSLNLSVTIKVGDVLPEDGHGRTVFHLDPLNNDPDVEKSFHAYAAMVLEENEG